ncbi:hypothetical protein [Thermococcus sp.]|uniref:hypothetical protein n=1 Tax=Thermococcus sp. TaxID=35749 RepID=UPI00262C7202|nr:hypothetical protein [Thermococcus sp.]
MDAKTSKLIELTVEALLIAWLGYLTIYQNYLLYNWHRGLPLPSRYLSLIAGILMGLAFFWYEWDKFERGSTGNTSPLVGEGTIEQESENSKESKSE